MNIRSLSLLTLLSVGCQSQMSHDKCDNNVISYEVPYENLVAESGDEASFGGFGSAMAYDSKSDTYYLLTDRGPNVDGKSGESKIFPFPDYSPTIGEFKIVGDSMILVRKIILKESDGRPILGLPNQEGDGVTGEIAYNYKGDVIGMGSRGVDSEGLAIAPDGTFWVSEEYAPFVMQFDHEGYLLQEFSPSSGLPSYFAKRRPNHGMEGLTISSDGTKLYGIMQSPLYIPDERTKNCSLNIRIIEIEIATKATKEYLYRLEDADLGVNDITYIGDNRMLVIERDGKFLNDGKKCIKHLYEIDITEATDISGMEIEMMSIDELRDNNISPVAKKLKLDILSSIPSYSHDKVEGVALVKNGDVAIINDDDFSIIENNDFGFEPKVKADGNVDHSRLYIISIK